MGSIFSRSTAVPSSRPGGTAAGSLPPAPPAPSPSSKASYHRVPLSSQLRFPSAPTVAACAGINYRANLYVDGTLVMGKERFVGTFRHFTLDLSAAIRASPGGKSVMALQVFPANDTLGDTGPLDLAISFVRAIAVVPTVCSSR